MAHFDSARNRVLWQRELEGLRREREMRQREGYEPSGTEAGRKPGIPSQVRRVTFAELEQMERESAARSLEGRGRQRDMTEARMSRRDMAGGQMRQQDMAGPRMRQPERNGPAGQPGGMGR